MGTEETRIARVEHQAAIQSMDDAVSVDRILNRRNQIVDTMQRAMKLDQDYGKVPGCGDKPTLLKPGAEKLLSLFMLAPKSFMEVIELPNGHREYRARCELYSITSGLYLGDGRGTCTTMESKYRFRKAERICPACSEPAIIKGKAEYGGGWLCWTKKGGCGAKFADNDSTIIDQEVGRVENPDLADLYNTCEKMADKRALVAAALKVTGASDLFTQDLEDIAKMDSVHDAEVQKESTEESPSTQAPVPAAPAPSKASKPAPRRAAPAKSNGSKPPTTVDDDKLLKRRRILMPDYQGEWPPKNSKGYTVRIPRSEGNPKMAWVDEPLADNVRGAIFHLLKEKGYEAKEDRDNLLIHLYSIYEVGKNEWFPLSDKRFTAGFGAWLCDALELIAPKSSPAKQSEPQWENPPTGGPRNEAYQEEIEAEKALDPDFV